MVVMWLLLSADDLESKDGLGKSSKADFGKGELGCEGAAEKVSLVGARARKASLLAEVEPGTLKLNKSFEQFRASLPEHSSSML